MRDRLGEVFADESFAEAFGRVGRRSRRQRVIAGGGLPFPENLTDRQAVAMAVRSTWKYAIGMELADTGFDHSVLPRFRALLTEHGLERVLFVFDQLLEHCREVVLSEEERAELSRWASGGAGSRSADRSRIVLSCADGASSSQVAADLGVNVATVRK